MDPLLGPPASTLIYHNFKTNVLFVFFVKYFLENVEIFLVFGGAKIIVNLKMISV